MTVAYGTRGYVEGQAYHIDVLLNRYRIGHGIFRPECVTLKPGTSDLYTGSEDGWVYKVPNGGKLSVIWKQL